ncbi:MAG: complex I NDUFA9 subunit family protein [Acetobacteraceae bacterium]
MIGPKVATVFGGSGFVGRYVVKRLAARGHVVRVAVRDTEAALFLKPMGAVGQIVPLYSDLRRPDDVARAVEAADIVVNLAGILAESRTGDFQRLHAEGAGAVARAAAKAGTGRLVHISALGADPAGPSEYAKSKAAGEAAVRAAFPAAIILRPSVVFGAEDQFFNRFGAMAQFLPCMPVIFGKTRMQPVYVGDVADAVMAVIDRTDAAGAMVELGGPHIFTFRQILQYVLRETGRHRILIPIPPALARLQAAIAERLPGKVLTRDQLLLLAHDNVASPDAPGLADLGITATPVDLVVPQYLGRFRPGGGRRELIAA